MITIIFITVGLILVFIPSIPFSASRELKRPNTFYLGGGLIVLAFILEFVEFPEAIGAWIPTAIPITALIAAIILSTQKVAIASNVEQPSSSGGRLINIITWILILGVSAVVIYTFVVGLR